MPLNIILIDDDNEEAELFEEAVRGLNQPINFKAYNNGMSAIEAIVENGDSPDMIFLDLNMPLFSGKDVLTKLRATYKGKDIPVVIYSTSISKKDVDELTRLEVNHFMTKPDNFESLRKRLQEVLP